MELKYFEEYFQKLTPTQNKVFTVAKDALPVLLSASKGEFCQLKSGAISAGSKLPLLGHSKEHTWVALNIADAPCLNYLEKHKYLYFFLPQECGAIEDGLEQSNPVSPQTMEPFLDSAFEARPIPLRRK